MAFVHPAFMLSLLVLIVVVLRLGLALRRRRISGVAPGRERIEQHVRWARPAVLLLVLGLLGGLVSAIWLRDWAPLGTLHSWLGVLTASLFVTAAWLGRALRLGRSRASAVHGAVALAGVALAALAAVAGFVLLP
ncbi:MAG: DUF4079 family protein [Myxococcota bacterium]